MPNITYTRIHFHQNIKHSLKESYRKCTAKIYAFTHTHTGTHQCKVLLAYGYFTTDLDNEQTNERTRMYERDLTRNKCVLSVYHYFFFVSSFCSCFAQTLVQKQHYRQQQQQL